MKSLSLVAMLFVAGCCSSRMSSDFQSGDADNAIRRIDRDFAAAAHAGDAAALAAAYADSAVLMPPNLPAFRGRDAIRTFWSGFLSAGQVDVTLTPDEITQSGDLATELGHYDLTIAPKGAAPVHDTGKYIVTWKKIGGAWKIAGDIFNSDLPAK